MRVEQITLLDMPKNSLERAIESLKLSDEQANVIRDAMKEMADELTKKPAKKVEKKDAKVILLEKMAKETDWKKRAALAAQIISLDL